MINPRFHSVRNILIVIGIFTALFLILINYDNSDPTGMITTEIDDSNRLS